MEFAGRVCGDDRIHVDRIGRAVAAEDYLRPRSAGQARACGAGELGRVVGAWKDDGGCCAVVADFVDCGISWGILVPAYVLEFAHWARTGLPAAGRVVHAFAAAVAVV